MIDFREKALRAIYGNWTTFLATCEITNFESRYDDWLQIGKQIFQECSTPVSFIFHANFCIVFTFIVIF